MHARCDVCRCSHLHNWCLHESVKTRRLLQIATKTHSMRDPASLFDASLTFSQTDPPCSSIAATGTTALVRVNVSASICWMRRRQRAHAQSWPRIDYCCAMHDRPNASRPTKTTHETTHKLQQNTCTDYRVARKNTTTAGRLRTKHPIAVYKINK